ncbi:Glycosyl hydrolase superfamily protein isoform 2 [Artemisia annua]|uniref:Chitinase domain-containing protein 1 n=1 Tax=Artemisia annua TaxID=35608 RepID=A0A2U1P355_ARTAN|nr:Glycosyl hydrolase superfamily protein isoform 2 [Artemisia annua]
MQSQFQAPNNQYPAQRGNQGYSAPNYQEPPSNELNNYIKVNDAKMRAMQNQISTLRNDFQSSITKQVYKFGLTLTFVLRLLLYKVAAVQGTFCICYLVLAWLLVFVKAFLMPIVKFHCPFVGLSGCRDGGGNGLTKTSLITHLRDRHFSGEAQAITRDSLLSNLVVFERVEVTLKCMGLWLCGSCFKTHTFRTKCRHGKGSDFVSPPDCGDGIVRFVIYDLPKPQVSLHVALVDDVVLDEFSGFDLALLDTLFSKGLRTVKEMDFDGIVLESWSRWVAYGILHDAKMRNLALQFIKKLGEEMHSVVVKRSTERNLQLQEYDFGPEDFRSLSNFVDGYSLMTYDFSNPQNRGPNAPLVWIRSTMKLLLGPHAADSQNLTQKVFLDINIYGNDYALQGGTGGGAILGRDYLSWLDKHKPQLKWENKSGEHFFFYTDENQHVVFYPSLLSIAMRLDEARSWGAGISIWEIGQAKENI